ncbi:hypothetical protein AB1N83_007859 [Pleurotus pulmonarius]
MGYISRRIARLNLRSLIGQHRHPCRALFLRTSQHDHTGSRSIADDLQVVQVEMSVLRRLRKSLYTYLGHVPSRRDVRLPVKRDCVVAFVSLFRLPSMANTQVGHTSFRPHPHRIVLPSHPHESATTAPHTSHMRSTPLLAAPAHQDTSPFANTLPPSSWILAPFALSAISRPESPSPSNLHANSSPLPHQPQHPICSVLRASRLSYAITLPREKCWKHGTAYVPKGR